MAKDTTGRPIFGETLPPERNDIHNEARRQLPYANPAELLDVMGGFYDRWKKRGKAIAAVDLANQLERLYRSYANLYATMAQLEHGRIEHGRAINELRHLDDILREDDRRRHAAFALAAQRDEVAQLQLQQQINMLKQQIATPSQAPAGTQETDDAEVPESPAEQLRKAATLRGELRKTVDDLIKQLKKEAGGNELSAELEEEIQRIKDDAERLLLHAASER